MAKPGRKPVRGVTQTERLFMRLTPEEKARIELSSDIAYQGGTISDYVRGVMNIVSDAAIQLEQGEITPEQFSEIVGMKVTQYVTGEEPKLYEPENDET